MFERPWLEIFVRSPLLPSLSFSSFSPFFFLSFLPSPSPSFFYLFNGSEPSAPCADRSDVNVESQRPYEWYLFLLRFRTSGDVASFGLEKNLITRQQWHYDCNLQSCDECNFTVWILFPLRSFLPRCCYVLRMYLVETNSNVSKFVAKTR